MDELTVYQTILIATAACQFAADGIVATDTYMALNLEGLDADDIINMIEETANG